MEFEKEHSAQSYYFLLSVLNRRMRPQTVSSVSQDRRTQPMPLCSMRNYPAGMFLPPGMQKVSRMFWCSDKGTLFFLENLSIPIFLFPSNEYL